MSFLSIYWGAAAMLLPFYIRSNSFNDVRISKNYALVFLSIFGSLLFGVKKIEIKAFLILILMAFFVHADFYKSAAIEQTAVFMSGILILCQMVGYGLNESIIKNFLGILCITVSSWFILNNLGLNPYNISERMIHPVGPLGQQTLSGALIAITLTSLFRSTWWMFLPAAFAGLYIAGSSMSYAAAAANVVIFTCLNKTLNKRAKAIFSLPILIGGSAIAANSTNLLNDNGRFYSWSVAIEKVSQFSGMEKLFGRGLGDFWHNFGHTMHDQVTRYAHNELIESVWAFGIVGTSIISILIYLAFKESKSPYASAGLSAVLVNSLGNFTLHSAPLALIGVIFYSIALTGGKNGYDCNTTS